VNCSKFAVMIVAVIASTTPSGYAQQARDPAPSSTAPAATATVAPSPASEADETAALIAKANAAAAANAKAAETAAASESTTKNAPSRQARKKASEFGFRAEIFDGKTMFCKEDAALGSRLTSKRCMDANEFEDYAVQLKIARDMMKSKGQCQGGSICGGIQ
jgi:hypothetical protein